MKFILIILFFAGLPIRAETIPDATQTDEVITNRSLRAMSGSKSKWSFAGTINYNGGNLASPFAQDRPNISGASATTTKTDLDGSLNTKYNYDPTHAIFVGFGFRYISPFSSSPGEDYGGKRFDAMNPNLILQYLYGFRKVQAVLQVKGLQWTQTDQTINGYAQQFAVDQESVWTLGDSGVSLALSSVVSTNTFNKSSAALNSVQSQYQLQLSPYAEYVLTPRYNVKAMLNLFSYENYRASSRSARNTVIGSVGMGISFTRDIFLYPSVSFAPGNLSSKATNVGAALNLNLF